MVVLRLPKSLEQSALDYSFIYVSEISYMFTFVFIMIFHISYLTHPPLPFLLSAKQAVDLDKWVC